MRCNHSLIVDEASMSGKWESERREESVS
jgi:hypothetical protein